MQQVSAQVVYPCRSLVAEACIWDPRDEVLYWVDILDSKVYRFDPRSACGWLCGAEER